MDEFWRAKKRIDLGDPTIAYVDESDGPEWAERLQQDIPQAALRRVSEVGHLAMEDRLGEFAAALREFIEP